MRFVYIVFVIVKLENNLICSRILKHSPRFSPRYQGSEKMFYFLTDTCELNHSQLCYLLVWKMKSKSIVKLHCSCKSEMCKYILLFILTDALNHLTAKQAKQRRKDSSLRKDKKVK